MDESKVVMKGRLGPGMMISVDLTSGQVCTVVVFLFLSFYFLFAFTWYLNMIIVLFKFYINPVSLIVLIIKLLKGFSLDKVNLLQNYLK